MMHNVWRAELLCVSPATSLRTAEVLEVDAALRDDAEDIMLNSYPVIVLHFILSQKNIMRIKALYSSSTHFAFKWETSHLSTNLLLDAMLFYFGRA